MIYYFYFSKNSYTIRSVVSENPTLEPNMEWIGRPVAEIWPFEMLVAFRFAICIFLCPMSVILILLRDMGIGVCWGHMEPYLGRKERS